jgi:hypothetical protein
MTDMIHVGFLIFAKRVIKETPEARDRWMEHEKERTKERKAANKNISSCWEKRNAFPLLCFTSPASSSH